jgi:hypothetical protein
MKRKSFISFLLVVCLTVVAVTILFRNTFHAKAQTTDNPPQPNIVWSTRINISQSPNKTSNDPYVVADPSGRVHLFWGEKFSNDPVNQADTLMYSTWDGSVWSEPLDIFTTVAANPLIAFPRALLDDQGRIHLFWMDQPKFPSQTLFYSSVDANQAINSQAWAEQVDLANDLTGTKFSFHAAYSPPSTLHVIYARIEQGYTPPDLRGMAYMRSDDLGETWSEPVNIFSVAEYQNGASDTRLLTVPPDKVFATWTEWDTSGNGQRIHVARSMDNGITWEEPFVLTQKAPNDYERDWPSMEYLGDEALVSVWEGGYRAYRQFQYSYDWGQTWSEPYDTFPWLIGETGTAEFARDSLGRLYLFYANRIREGNVTKGEASGLWYSIWLGDKDWSEPELIANEPVLNPRVTIMNGKYIVATWTSTVHYEIMVLTGQILDAPMIQPVDFHSSGSSPTSTSIEESAATPDETSSSPLLASPSPIAGIDDLPEQGSVSFPILLGSFTSICFIIGLLFYAYRNRK